LISSALIIPNKAASSVILRAGDLEVNISQQAKGLFGTD
jgi:hypothetical protein